MAWSSQSLRPGDLCPAPELLGLTLLFCSPDIPPPPPPIRLPEQAGQGQDPWELRAVQRALRSTDPSWAGWGC